MMEILFLSLIALFRWSSENNFKLKLRKLKAMAKLEASLKAEPS